jgi:hypothetical protein
MSNNNNSNSNSNNNNSNSNYNNESRDEPFSMDAESETGDTTTTTTTTATATANESVAARFAAAAAEIPIDIRTGIPIRNTRSVSTSAVMNHQAMLRQQSPPVASGRATSTGERGGAGLSMSSTGGLHPNNNLGAATFRLEDLNLNLNNTTNNNHNNNHNTNNPSNHNINNNINNNNQDRPSIAIPEQDVALLESPTDGGSSSSSNNGWSIVETNGGTPPSARSLHAAALLNGIVYVFGGYDGVQRVNTFHAFSFAEKRWSPVLPSSNSSTPPSPRDRHVAVAFGNSFYVHGGFDGTSRVSDFWGFDFSSMTWREVVVASGRAPSPRHSHAAVVHRHSLYIFGGYDGSYK